MQSRFRKRAAVTLRLVLCLGIIPKIDEDLQLHHHHLASSVTTNQNLETFRSPTTTIGCCISFTYASSVPFFKLRIVFIVIIKFRIRQLFCM
jgi:hypothetical protein